MLTRTALERRQSLISPASPRLSLTARAASSERASILNLLQWTYGIVIITRRKDMINIKKVFVNPVTISLVIGLFLFITGIKLPGVINSTMAGVAALNTPAAMIVLGYYLSCVRICDLLLNPSLYLATFVRLIIIPLLTLLVLYIIPVGHGQIGMITLIAAATPVGTSTAIFAQKFGQDYERAGMYGLPVNAVFNYYDASCDVSGADVDYVV